MSRAVIFALMAMLALAVAPPAQWARSESSAVGPSGDAGQTRTDLATRAACRQRANEMYDQRDRARSYASIHGEHAILRQFNRWRAEPGAVRSIRLRPDDRRV